MLAQFLDRYPTGSLVSELLTIYQGKFVVRVAAQVEGVVRTTGMAVSESLELAEDQARSRALMVLGIELTQKTEKQRWGDGEVEEGMSVARHLSHGGDSSRESPQASSPALFSWDQVDAAVENFGNVTPMEPRNYSEEITGTLDQKDAETTMEASEPIDLSDAIARTSVELKRLGWGTQQGREYLKQTYNKRSRQELTDQEMLEFLHYLESQPS